MSEPIEPAREAETGDSNLGDLLSRRHQPQRAHEPHREVGSPDEDDDQGDAPAAPAPSAATPAPSPQAAPKPESAPAADAGDRTTTDPSEEDKGPKWYREAMKRMRQENARLRAETEGRPTGRPSPQTQPQPRPAPELPNPAEDPVGYYNAIERMQNQRFESFELATTLRLSERFARQQHGNDAFDEVHTWLTTRPDLEEHFTRQPDPWGAAFAYYQRERLAEEIGDDPAAWREKERQRIREELQKEMAGGDPPAAPAAPTMRRAPPPPPASTVRSAQPRDPSGRFQPGSLKFRNSFD
jgi:hypothetical protein